MIDYLSRWSCDIILSKMNIVPFVSAKYMMKLVLSIEIERFLRELSEYVEHDFKRWDGFDKVARVAAHSINGVIELMPTSNDTFYGFKYVNGHPKNTKDGRQTVTVFGVFADVTTDYPILLLK